MKTIELFGVVGYDFTAEDLKKQLGKSREEVRIKVESPGGSVFEAVRMYNIIKDYPGKVTAELGALAASAASYFPLSADKIEVRENTTYMAHKAWSLAVGNSDDMAAESLILEGLDGIIATAYAKKTGRDKKDIMEDMKNEIWIFGGENIVISGFADAVVKEDEKTETMEKPEVVAKLEEVKQILKTSEEFTNEMKRAAKMIEVKDTVQEIINGIDPSLTEEIVIEEAHMKLNEYLEKNPEAKAEIEASNAASMTGAIEKERERVNGLLEIAGLKISDELKASIANGDAIGDFAIKEVKAQREKMANAEPQDFGKFKPEAKAPKDTAPKPEKNKDIDAWDALYGKKEDK